MNRTAFKCLFFCSLGFLVTLIQFTFVIWILANVGAALFALLLMLDEDVRITTGIPLGVFLSNFFGSPLSYVYLADLVCITTFGLLAFLKPRNDKR